MQMSQSMILVALGANLQGPGGRNPLETCEWAVHRLARLPGLSLVARSRWFESAPVPPSGQPNYVNGVVRLEGQAEPAALLAALHGIEAEGGRVRGEVNAARTLDLDLLAIDGLIIDTPAVVLPHPRMALRGFVLAPLAEVAPDWIHPLLHGSVSALLSRCDQSGLAPLPVQTAVILAQTDCLA